MDIIEWTCEMNFVWPQEIRGWQCAFEGKVHPKKQVTLRWKSQRKGHKYNWLLVNTPSSSEGISF